MVRIVVRVLGWCLGRIPTLLVWAGLVGLFVYGARHGWKFGEPSEKEAKEKPEVPEPAAYSAFIQERPFDVPIQVTHDPKTCPVGEKPIQFKSPEAAKLAGIATVKLEPRSVTVEIVAHGEVQQDPTATAKVSPLVGGLFVALEKQLGDPVRAGELLALVESADVGKAKAAYLTAKVGYESREAERALLSPGSSPPASILKADAAVREAKAALFSARQSIGNLGLPLPSAKEERLPDEAFTQKLALLGIPFFKRLELHVQSQSHGRPLPANLLPLFSPLDGVIVKRFGVVGETIAALQPVYEVGDPTRVQVFLDLRQEDMAKVALGQEMSFKLEGGADLPAVAGKLDWVSSMLDDKTRTVRVRAKVANPGGILKSGSFGGGIVTVEPSRPALMVPREAMHWEGCSHIVFVKKKDGDETVYWPRKVLLGVRDERGIEVVKGLGAGDEIVIVGSHVLKRELLRARIGDAGE